MERPKRVKQEELRGIPQTNRRWPWNNETLTRKRKEAARKQIDAKREKVQQKLERGERLPNEWERKALDVTNQLMTKEFKRLGLVDNKTGDSLYVPTLPQQLRIVVDKENHPLAETFGPLTYGTSSSTNGIIYVISEENREDFFHTLFHENIHLASFTTFGPSIPYGKESDWEYFPDLSHLSSRTGYMRSRSRMRSGIFSSSNFHTFNEAVTESMCRRLLQENATVIAEQLPKITPEKLSAGGNHLYPTARATLSAIVSELATHTGEDEDAVRDRIEEGLFSGNMMQLRSVEKAFGENTLLLISLMSEVDPKQADTVELVQKFLREPGAENKFYLAAAILSTSRNFALFVAQAYSRSIKQFLRMPLPEKKDSPYEDRLSTTLEHVGDKRWAVETFNTAARARDAVEQERADVEERKRAYEEKFGPIEREKREEAA